MLLSDRSKIHGRKDSLISWLFLALFLTAVIVRLIPGPRIIDDAYITYRYVQNLLSGNGLVYNPGERVLGTTTPFYSLLLATISSILQGGQQNLPRISIVINALADGASCLLLFAIGHRLGWSAAGLGAALVWAIAPFSVTFAIGGLETSIVVSLLLAAWYTYLTKNTIWTALFAALLLLTRPDTLILIGPLALDRAYQIFKNLRSEQNEGHAIRFRNLKRYLYEILALGLPASIWLTFAAFYYGSPIPHSITAKSLAYQLPPDAALLRFIQHYATPFMEQYTLTAGWLTTLALLYLFLALLGGWLGVRRSPRSWPFFLFPWLYMLVFSVANPLVFRWYLTPPLPVYILSILIGAQHLLTKGRDSLYTQGWVSGKPVNAIIDKGYQILMMIVLILAPVLLTLQGWDLAAEQSDNRPTPKMAWIELENLYYQVSERLQPSLAEHAGKKVVLAAGDVGVLGYFTGAAILDLVGLNSPQSTHYYPANPEIYVINYAIPPELVMDQLPDYLVILEVYGREGLLKDQRFLERYHLLEKIDTDIYGSDGLLIFELGSP